MRTIAVFVVALLLIPALALAQEKPTSEETRKVIDYYFAGEGQGAVLMSFKICEKIAEEGPMKNDCIADADPQKISLGSDAYLWMSFLVPENEPADILISFARNNRIRKTMDVTLSNAFRYRTWKKLPADKAGSWTVNIIQEMADKDLDLGSLKYTVVEANP